MNLDLARVAITGNKGSRGRLLAIAAGVAVGVAILLILWGAHSGVRARDERSAWTLIWRAPTVVDAGGDPGRISEDSIFAAQTFDYFGDERILMISVAAHPDNTVPFPGGITPPGAGEYYASPALAKLIDGAPADQLGNRYGTRVGMLPPSTLNGPESLVVLVGHDPYAEGASGYFSNITGFDQVGRGENTAYQVILIIGGIAVFFPVVLFISIVTQLGAAQRQESFATLRLIGASPKAVAGIAASEMAVTSLIGALGGVALAYAIRPLAAMVPMNGEASYTSDFALSPGKVITVIVAMVVVSTLAAAWRIQRAGIGPLGVTRQLREGRPSPLRVVPLSVGLGAMVFSIVSIQSGSSNSSLINLLLIAGFALTCFGIVIIGPWLTYLLTHLLARFARSAESVIASSRILATPAATFRSVGGLVVAVFLVSVFAGSASVVTDTSPREEAGLLPLDTLTLYVADVPDLPSFVASLEGVHGVTDVIPVHTLDERSEYYGWTAISADDARALGIREIPEADWLALDHFRFTSVDPDSVPTLYPLASDEVHSPEYLYIKTDGTQAAIERARTMTTQLEFRGGVALTRADLADIGTTRLVNSLAVLAYLGIFFSVTIAGISLAVATVAAMLDRKRVLGLMRLMGMPAGSVRRIIGLEAAVPLVAVLGASVALGFFVAWLIVVGIGSGDYQMSWPDPLYFVILAVSLALAGLAIAAGTATVNRNTSVTATRFE